MSKIVRSTKFITVYNTTDYGEIDEWHTTKVEAIKSAKENVANAKEQIKGMEYGDYQYQKIAADAVRTIYVIEHKIPYPINRDLVCKLLTGEGFSHSQRTLYPKGK